MFGWFSRKKVNRTLYGTHVRRIRWTDCVNKLGLELESIHFNFYEHSDGTRSCEWDYEGTLVREYNMAKDYQHIVRKWEDAGIVPKNTTIYNRKKSGEVLKLVVNNSLDLPPAS